MGAGRAVWPHHGGLPAQRAIFPPIAGAAAAGAARSSLAKNSGRSLHHPEPDLIWVCHEFFAVDEAPGPRLVLSTVPRGKCQ